MSDEFYKGFMDLADMFDELIQKTSDPQDVLVVGADLYVKDLMKLPRPYSKLKRTKSRHMLDTMQYRRAKNSEVEVGADVYWLNFVNLGTSSSGKRKWATPANPFMNRLWSQNKNKYHEAMIKKIGL